MASRWSKLAALSLTLICLIGLFSTEITDTDFWWHLKTGQYIVEHRSLPIPDPFAYTTSLSSEDQVQHFNLTHEWLAQTLLCMGYSLAGFPAIVFVRALILAALFGICGFLAARLLQSFFAGISPPLALSFMAVP